MDDTTRSAIPITQALTIGDRAWVGMDTYTDPNKLQDGYAQRITNLVSQNGSLVPRKGIQRQTTTARSGSYYASIAVRSSKNVPSTSVLVAESNGSLDAGFWKFDGQHTDALPIPMSATGTLTFSNIEPDLVRMAQLGRYIYVAPGTATSGTSNYPLRIDTNTKSQKLLTVAIGTNKFTKAGHGLTVGDPIVIVAASGSLPSPLATDIVYFVTHVAGNDFYVASSLPTTTTTSVSHITFSSSATTVTIVTTFKGETVPVATGLVDIAPTAEAYPWIAKDIPTSNFHQIVTNGLTLSASTQMLTNNNFATPGTNNDAPGTWSNYIGAGTGQVTTKVGGDIPRTTTGQVVLIDGNSSSGTYPGLYQSVQVRTETNALYNGSSTDPCLMYLCRVSLMHYEQSNSPRKRPVSIRVRAGTNTGSFVQVDGAIVSTQFDVRGNGKNKDAWTVIDILADFRDFKSQLSTSSHIQVEIQADADFGDITSGEGLYVDYIDLYPVATRAITNSGDTILDPTTKLVRVRATPLGASQTHAYAGYVRDRAFYYTLASSQSVTINTSGTHTAAAAVPTNGTPVSFSSTTGTGLTANKTYYIINRTTAGTSFQLSAEFNGSAVIPTGTASLTMLAGSRLRTADYLSMECYIPAEFASQNPQFSIGIQYQTSTGIPTVVTWGGKGTLDSKNRYLTFDLRSFDKSLLEQVVAVYIRCDSDFFVSSATDAASVFTNRILFYIGKLVYNGDLGISGLYEYGFTRWKAAPSYTTNTTTAAFTAVAPWTKSGSTSTYFGGVESELSKTSVPFNSSNAESRLRVTINSSDFKDSAGAGYTHILVYRRNNTVFPDGKFRLLGQIDISGATPSLAASSLNLSLDSTSTSASLVLIDNVGDSELLFDKPIGQTGYVYRDGKDFFPIGCENIAIHQQRVWMSKENTLYASWLLDTDNEYALHTTIVPVAADPYLPIKGASLVISGAYDYEPITALVPFSGEGLSKSNSSSNALLVLRNNSILPLVGVDATNFAILGFVREPGAGCIAPMCASTFNGRVWWLSNSGISQYTNGLPAAMSKPLDRLVNARTNNPLYNPTSGNLTINQALQRKSSCVVFDNKFVFSSSQPGGTGLTTLFVFDAVLGGWYEWSFPQDGGGSATEPRSMWVLNSDQDAPELYFGASNGHIYKYIGTQDIAVTTPASFTWSVLTRQYGQTYAQGQDYYRQNKVHQLDLHLETTASLAVDWRIYMQEQPQLVSPVFNNPTYTFHSSGTWTFNTGNKSAAIRNIKRDMRGTTYSVQISGTSLASDNWFRLYGILLHVNEGGIRRQN